MTYYCKMPSQHNLNLSLRAGISGASFTLLIKILITVFIGRIRPAKCESLFVGRTSGEVRVTVRDSGRRGIKSTGLTAEYVIQLGLGSAKGRTVFIVFASARLLVSTDTVTKSAP